MNYKLTSFLCQNYQFKGSHFRETNPEEKQLKNGTAQKHYST